MRRRQVIHCDDPLKRAKEDDDDNRKKRVLVSIDFFQPDNNSKACEFFHESSIYILVRLKDTDMATLTSVPVLAVVADPCTVKKSPETSG